MRIIYTAPKPETFAFQDFATMDIFTETQFCGLGHTEDGLDILYLATDRELFLRSSKVADLRRRLEEFETFLDLRPYQDLDGQRERIKADVAKARAARRAESLAED